MEAGRPLTEIAARLGHERTRVTLELYGHWLHPDDTMSAAVTPDFSVAAG
jgi:hypothetical protein